MRTARAFTLIELMVVVAIIVLLVAILVPLLGRARDSAKSARCQSNLHQIGLGISSYVAQHNIMPTPGNWHDSTGIYASNINLNWPEALIKEGDMQQAMSKKSEYSGFGAGAFICPSHNPKFQGGTGVDPTVDPTKDLANHYDADVFDGYGLNYQVWGVGPSQVNLGHIIAADAWVNFENGSSNLGTIGATPGDATETGPVDARGTYYGVYPRHMGSNTYRGQTYTWVGNGGPPLPKMGGGSNYLMGDYHVEYSLDYGHICMSGSAVNRPSPFSIWQHP